MNDDQYRFLEQLATRIPRLFEAIRQGNVKSEYIVGIRRIGTRHVRLKLVAEVVDPGANPLESHSRLRSVVVRAEVDDVGSVLRADASETDRRQLKAISQALRNSDCTTEPPPSSRQPHPFKTSDPTDD